MPRYWQEAYRDGRPTGLMRPMHETVIIVPMAHDRSSQPRLSPSSYEEDIRAVLAPRLAYFEAVARHEHVTRAAQELGVPQSTLSRAMVRLEQDLGVALFARRGRTVALTPAGRTFLGSAERALAEVEKAADSVRADADPASGRVAFGFLHTMGSETVPALIRAFRADHPGVRFQLVQNYGEAMLERLRAGKLDLCLTSPVPDAPDLVAHAAGRAAAAAGRPRGPPAGRPPPGPSRGGRRGDLRDPGAGVRTAADHRRPLRGGRVRAQGRVRGRGGGDPARSGRRRTRRRPAAAPAVARPGVVELTVTAPRAAREIGVAWLDGHPDTPPVAAFKEFLISRRGHLLPD